MGVPAAVSQRAKDIRDEIHGNHISLIHQYLTVANQEAWLEENETRLWLAVGYFYAGAGR